MFSLDGKVAIITGAARGIGFGIASVMAAQGAIVCLVDRNETDGVLSAKSLATQGLKAEFFSCDLCDKAQIYDLVAAVEAKFGRVDIMVHNAGAFPFVSIDDLNDEQLDLTINVNLKAAIYLTKAVAPIMTRQRKGRILFTSSISGPHTGSPLLAHYGATKAGVNGFIKSAALEYARRGITVNGIEPGLTRTQAWEGLASDKEMDELGKCVPVGRMARPADMAHAMAFLASDEAEYVTGQTIVVDGGLTAIETEASLMAFYQEAGEV